MDAEGKFFSRGNIISMIICESGQQILLGYKILSLVVSKYEAFITSVR